MVWVWGVESLKTEYTILLLASQTGCCPEQAVKCGRFQSVYMYMCVCEGGFISLNTGWRVSCLKWSSETDGFKALWRHTGYINEGASGIGSNSLINPVNLPLPLYFYTLHKHIRKSIFLSFFFFLLICPMV